MSFVRLLILMKYFYSVMKCEKMIDHNEVNEV